MPMSVPEFITKLTTMANMAIATLYSQIQEARADGKITGWERFMIVQSGVFSFMPVVSFIIDFARQASDQDMSEAGSALNEK